MRITVTTAAAANSNNKQRCNSNKTNKNGIPFMLNNSDGKMRTQRNMKSKKPRSINNILFSYRSTSNRIGVYTNWEQFSFEIQISRQSLFWVIFFSFVRGSRSLRSHRSHSPWANGNKPSSMSSQAIGYSFSFSFFLLFISFCTM